MEPILTGVSADEYSALTALWEDSVRATHHFLREEDIAYYRPLIRERYLPALQLTAVRNGQGAIGAFMGTADRRIEMLFVDPRLRGGGWGKLLLRHAIDSLGCTAVDVNEQNTQAVGFYHHMGFRTVGRSALDPDGKPYPILHLEL